MPWISSSIPYSIFQVSLAFETVTSAGRVPCHSRRTFLHRALLYWREIGIHRRYRLMQMRIKFFPRIDLLDVELSKHSSCLRVKSMPRDSRRTHFPPQRCFRLSITSSSLEKFNCVFMCIGDVHLRAFVCFPRLPWRATRRPCALPHQVQLSSAAARAGHSFGCRPGHFDFAGVRRA